MNSMCVFRPGFRKLRIEAGFSLRGLATAAGVNVQTIASAENNAGRGVRPATAKRICTALRMDFAEVFEIMEVE